MPLDMGDISEGQSVHPQDDHILAARPAAPVLSPSGHVGSALQAARVSLGLAENDIARVTRVRAPYIEAIEAFDFEALPPRPFVVGYVRAYAQALGLDAEAVVARLHAEAPTVDGKLRAPGGVSHDAFARIRSLLMTAGALAAAVVAWNLWRHSDHHIGPTRGPAATAPVKPATGPAQIGAPLPTPPEATTPPVYVTPGLEAQSVAGVDAPPSAETPPNPAAAVFAASGPVYGAAPMSGDVILQARKSTGLVVRGPGGAVIFARQLAAGEAWRGSTSAGLIADVDSPAVVEVFVGGVSHGRLTQPQTALGLLNPK